MSERRKLTIVFDPYEPPPEPSPQVCRLCGEERPGWQFARRLFCFDCSTGHVSFETMLGLSFNDMGLLQDAHSALNALAKEVRHGR